MAAIRREGADTCDEVVRLLAAQLRLQLGTQALTISELSRAGFSATRIAELLGTTPGTVHVALQRSKRTSRPIRSSTDEGA